NFATDWGISNHQKATFSFQNILEEKQGTLLYVDFWASWCLKSIRQAPALEKLYNDYNTKGVSIVHISADSEIEKWKWADNEYLWFNQSNSYMLDSSDVAIIRDEFLIYSIPRYLLFDRNGKLVHINAPEPSSSEIRDLLDAHLGNTPI